MPERAPKKVQKSTKSEEAPKEVVRKGFGRIQFGHSELSGYMSHTLALIEGSRAAIDVMKHIN